ncbi:MAG: S-layer homology domain-containing protein [Oscillospiraceae bacterium]|nr:S-layer homology domain-containing protein [Oscillospiraceae bacterium]
MGRYFKTFALLCAAALVCRFCLCADAAPRNDVGDFKDVSSGDWYFEYVKRLYEGGIVNGVAQDSYAPGAEVQTSELAALIARYLGLEYAAQKSRDFLQRNEIEGADLWYSGYIGLMFDLGIFAEAELSGYGIKLMDGGMGGAAISKGAAAALEAPVKRMDVAKFIAKSFEIKKGRTPTNFLKSEISGNGNEFITGGGYDREILERIKSMISDYSDIPGQYREYFLKCYYNGIIRGDEKGRVLPAHTLKRGELAKIIASVLYFDLRGDELRELPAACAIGQSDCYISPADNSRSLKPDKAERILSEQAKNIRTENQKDFVNVVVEQKNIIPAGYLSEIYVYAYNTGGEPAEIGKSNCASNPDEYFPREAAFALSKTNRSGELGFVYLILRDLAKNGEVAGALKYDIGQDGNLKSIPAYNLP